MGFLTNAQLILLSATLNLFIVLSEARMAHWFQTRSAYIQPQKWVMAGILTSLTVRMAVDKGN